MDIQKLVEEEMKKMLKEDEPTAAAPKEVIFKNKNADAAKCVKSGAPLPNSIGLICGKSSQNDTAFSASLLEKFSWVAPNDKNDYSVKTSDPALIKKYSRQPLKPRADVLELQALMNKWLASKLNPSPYAFRGMRGSKRSGVNEDGLWGPKSQEGLDRIRSLDKNVPPNGSGIPKILQYFKSIEAQMAPLAPAAPTAAPVSATTAQPAVAPQEIASGYGSKQEPVEFEEFEKLSPKNKANKIVYYTKDDSVYGAKFNADGTAYTLTGKFAKVQQESKLIRKMIIQEVYKSLRR
jgi:hypothetical protein